MFTQSPAFIIKRHPTSILIADHFCDKLHRVVVGYIVSTSESIVFHQNLQLQGVETKYDGMDTLTTTLFVVVESVFTFKQTLQ